MSLFEVPGWRVPAAPFPSTNRKKRKRLSNAAPDKLESAANNIESLMQKLEGADKSKDRKGKKRKIDDMNVKKQPAQPEQGPESARESPHTGKSKKKKKNKTTSDLSEKEQAESVERSGRRKEIPASKKASKREESRSGGGPTSSKPSLKSPGLTDLQAQMKQSLDGARFRLINETLYKSDSGHAYQMMKDDPNIFEEYHKGFRHQVQSWPANPISHYIETLSTYPARTVIADLGCGDAALAKALVPKDLTVLSFDLVSDDKYVIEADICAKLPLPGSESNVEDEESQSNAQVVDVVVCALSLMGTNWPGCIREAWRVLRSGGELKVAEVASRFTDIEAFVSLITSIGFKLKSKDDQNTHFTLFEFRKVSRKHEISEKEWEKILSRGSLLKSCEYKRR
ncbi:ribosomal RNA-processing protein 8 [Neolentinus lepideus HHB14362 ss-1]|uniref:Ribosomal RNA-processing protein 8 n=1 Tax=Neolentinus lepideus HHB14362 ss-1 TaxID=1314782 RepID=A0A165PAV1_9AGAM|nr:ribosomal RNA-processing protein 8 [Neolentinus lepideus HHB14362 ss-1]